MKKTRFLVIGFLSALCIVGCNDNSTKKTNKPKKQERVIEHYEDDGSEHHEPMYITNNYGQDASKELVVQWQNVDGSTNQRVQITTADDTEFTYAHNVEAEYRLFDINTSVAGEYDKNGIYRADITGLKPGTEYIYRVGANDAWSTTYNHLTAEGEEAEFSFTVTSDPQSPQHTQMEKTLTAANNYDPDHRFFFLCGDLVNDMGKAPSEIKSYTDAASKFNTRRIIATTEGNHDTYEKNQGDNVYRFGNAQVFNAFTTFPKNGFETDADKSNSYYFRYNNVLFITLNTLIADDSYTPEANWMKNVLDEESDAEYIVVTMHIGPFQSESGSEWKEPNVRAAFLKIFADYKVDVVFYGHDHAYGRTNPIVLTGNETTADLKTVDTTPVANGTVFSMVGATGPKFYSLGNNLYQENIFEKRSEASPGSFVNVKVLEDKLEINALRMPSTGEELTNIDSYSIPKKSR